jgi:hypothetical protein
MLERVDGKLGENHSGELHRETADQKAKRIRSEELARRGWTPVIRKGIPALPDGTSGERREPDLPMVQVRRTDLERPCRRAGGFEEVCEPRPVRYSLPFRTKPAVVIPRTRDVVVPARSASSDFGLRASFGARISGFGLTVFDVIWRS